MSKEVVQKKAEPLASSDGKKRNRKGYRNEGGELTKSEKGKKKIKGIRHPWACNSNPTKETTKK